MGIGQRRHRQVPHKNKATHSGVEDLHKSIQLIKTFMGIGQRRQRQIPHKNKATNSGVEDCIKVCN
jgi:hypothetical protein